MTEAATADMFRVDPSRVGMLNPYEAVDLAARLIRSDASDSGVLEDVVIDIPLNITAPDGGVDGTATGSPRQSIRGLVKKGTTAYQFRTGTFTPNSSIASILLTKQGEVKPRIRSCIQGGGTLVVLLLGWDGTAHMDDDTLAERFRRTLEAKSGELAGAKVDVWGLNRIVDAIERFPGIAADVGGGIPAGTLAMSHREWSCTTDMAQAFKHGRAEDDVIKEIRDCLRSGGGMPVHARVSGQPGSGKTRLVLEATRADDLAPRVVYAANPDVAESVIAAHARRAGGAGSARLIVIADECDLPDQFRIWSRLRGNSKEADLVTIYNEPGLDKETTTQIKVADMGDEQIAEILEGYMKDKNDRVHAWVDYCRPSPRAAHIVGHNFVTHPDRILEDPHDSGVWERYIAGREETGSREYRDRLTVLLWLSQFTRFGFDKPYERDWAQIAEIVHERHPEVPAYRFREVVRTLRSMKVLQGGSVLYITPRILHEYMWLKWWDRYGPGDVPCPPPPGVNGGPGAAGRGAAAATAVAAEGVALPSLHSRYCEMLARMKGGTEAARAAESLFGKGGPLDGGAASGGALGSDLFAAASNVSPAAAIEYAEAAVGAILRDDRRAALALHGNAAVAAARRLLGGRETFARAARLLLALADAGAGAGDSGGAHAFEAEAARTFSAAFDPAPGAGLPGIPLAERLGVLAEGVRGGGDGSDGRPARGGTHSRRVALRACGAVLTMRHFSTAIPHLRGAGSNVTYWRPANRDELASYLQGVLGLLVEAGRDPRNGAAVRREAAGAVLGSLAQAALLPEIAEASVRAAEDMCAAGLLGGEALLAVAERLAVHESHRIAPAAMRRIRAIVDRGAAEAGLHERLAWRIGRDGYACRNKLGTVENDRKEIGLLAGELAADPAVLDAEIAWIAGGDAIGWGAAMLGYALAPHDAGGDLGGRLLGRIVREAGQAGPDGDGDDSSIVYLLAGYLAWMCKNRPGAAEGAMDRILEAGGAPCGALPIAVNMSGIVSDRSARRLAQAVRGGSVKRGALAGIVRGSAFDGISEDAFCDVVDSLAAGKAAGAAAPAAERGRLRSGGGDSDSDSDSCMAGSAALDMAHARYIGRRHDGGGGRGGRVGPLHAETVAKILLHGDVLGCKAGSGMWHVDVGRWAETALALARQEGEGAAALLSEAVIGRLGLPGMFEDAAAVKAVAPALDEIARAHPRIVWRIAASFMGPPFDKRASLVRAWLAGKAGALVRGREGAPGEKGAGGIGAVPAPVVLEWAAEDPRTRPLRVSELLSPPRLDLARDLVARFGGSEGVVDGVTRALVSWQADRPPVADTEGALAQLESMRRGKCDRRTEAWLDRCIAQLASEIARAQGHGVGPGPPPLLSR